jgi:hypothetical protein
MINIDVMLCILCDIMCKASKIENTEYERTDFQETARNPVALSCTSCDAAVRRARDDLQRSEQREEGVQPNTYTLSPRIVIQGVGPLVPISV